MLSLLNNLQLRIRSGLFYISYASLTAFVSFTAFIIVRFVSYRTRFAYISLWSRGCVFATRIFCGIRYEIEGIDNLPKDQPYVVLAKHQSQWETYFLMLLLKPITIICKKELLKIPGFGYCLSVIRPIAIARSQPKQALKDIQRIGLERLQKERIPVLVFPEGTRTDIGKTGKYARGGAALAIKAGVPVILISHNAGYCWPSGQFIKKPGLINIYISEPISSEGKTALELTNEAEQWIESHVLYKNESDNPAGVL